VPILSDYPKSPMPVLGITTGDPAGVGPEISLRAASDPSVRQSARLYLYGDSALLRERAVCLGLPFDLPSIAPESLLNRQRLPDHAVVHIPARVSEIHPGSGSAASGEAAAHNIVECARACLGGALDAMVTAPLSKKHLNEAGFHYPGHTEFLAELGGSPEVAMAFLTERLKVVLATIHVPLRAVIDLITQETILTKLAIILHEFPRLGLPCRRVAVAGLNPHAGEDGLLGTEEAERIRPALDQARSRYREVEIAGPLPADTLFYRAAQGEFDVVLALYHDQGLGPIKVMGFGEAVNVTLGLPFVRTSVDHGTAFDIAGKGLARAESMIGAIRWAIRLCRHR
jgi:4-hydroxythreonine-4-phosphate dehydrogenase